MLLKLVAHHDFAQDSEFVDDPAASHIPGRLADHDYNSARSFQLEKQWMRECEVRHPNCPKAQSTLPTRVLDLYLFDNSDDLRLSVSNGLVGKYACLSYCWGSGFQSTQLNSSNLPSLVKRISFRLLPRSIQDAIATVRRLGLRYLWIDALCIIQDSLDDKAQQIKQMHEVYNNAYLTISAANADDCSRGFLAKRDQAYSDGDIPPVRLPFLCSKGGKGRFLRPKGGIGNVTLFTYGAPTRREPLYRRSWPFQEYLFSPRVLMYGSDQMLWICQQDNPCGIGATFKDGGPAHDSSVTELKYMRMFLFRSQVISPGFARRNLWIDLVIEYSPREQSIPDDKINALRGIATRYQDSMDDDYIAGLWKSWLIPGLMWKRSGKIHHRRKRQYPSWSWLSIDSAVTMDRAHNDLYMPGNFLDVEFISYMPCPSGQTLSPFGLLPEATLQMRGHLKKLEPPEWQAMLLSYSNVIEAQKTSLQPQPARVVLDTIESTVPNLMPVEVPGPVWCLPMIRVHVADHSTDKYIGYAVQGLVLLQKSESGFFERIGWFISEVEEYANFLTGVRQDLFID